MLINSEYRIMSLLPKYLWYSPRKILDLFNFQPNIVHINPLLVPLSLANYVGALKLKLFLKLSLVSSITLSKKSQNNPFKIVKNYPL